MGKKAVLLVHNYYQVPGGEDSVVANEMQMLQNHGHKVVLYSRDNSELNTMSKLKKILIPFLTIFNFRTFFDVRKIIKTEKIDVVHIHNTLNLISPAVYYAALGCGTSVVQTIHNFRLLCPAATFYRDGQICEKCVEKGLLNAVKHKCYRNSTIQTLACVMNTYIHRVLGVYKRINYICLTEFNKQKLLQQGQIRSNQVFVKPNFVKQADGYIPEYERKNQFVFAGRLDKLKGIEVLIKSWKIMGDKAPQLIICGTGPLENWCKKQISETDNIEMMGFVDNQSVRKIIAESRGMILPTQWYEGFPMSIVEAYSVGTPVVCSDLGNAGSIVQEGITGCKFKCDSTEDLISAIRRCSGFCESVYRNYKELYSEEINYKKLIEIYERI